MGSMSDVVEHTDVVCLPKRTLAEQAGKGRVLLPVNFFRLSEARLRNSLADKHSTACKARCSRGGYTTTFNKEPKYGASRSALCGINCLLSVLSIIINKTLIHSAPELDT